MLEQEVETEGLALAPYLLRTIKVPADPTPIHHDRIFQPKGGSAMLDPWIIEEIIRREREEQQKQERRIEVPLQSPPRYHDSDAQVTTPPAEEKDRGVTVIDI
jgi:hypothetical protein